MTIVSALLPVERPFDLLRLSETRVDTGIHVSSGTLSQAQATIVRMHDFRDTVSHSVTWRYET